MSFGRHCDDDHGAMLTSYDKGTAMMTTAMMMQPCSYRNRGNHGCVRLCLPTDSCHDVSCGMCLPLGGHYDGDANAAVHDCYIPPQHAFLANMSMVLLLLHGCIAMA